MNPNPDFLHVFTGISGTQIIDFIQTALSKRTEIETDLIERLMRRPIESMAGFILSTSVAFYLAERDVNPKISTFVDAVYYISTCMSVGYADIFAVTQTGKSIATLVMAVGPALAAKSLDLPQTTSSESNSKEILERLDAILVELRKN